MVRTLDELDIPANVKNEITLVMKTLLEKFSSNINKMILFGSYATCKYQPDSDIDIAVSLNEMPDIKERRYYKQAIDLERDVDLLFCTREQLSGELYIYGRIAEQGVVLYEQL